MRDTGRPTCVRLFLGCILQFIIVTSCNSSLTVNSSPRSTTSISKIAVDSDKLDIKSGGAG